MSEALAAGDTRVRALIEADAPTVFGDLNAALFEDGLVIEIAPRTVVDEPLHVACILAAGAEPIIVSPRLLVRVGEQAQLTLIESFAGIGDGVGFTNAVVHVDVAPSATVKHVKLQREPASAYHLATTVARVDRAGTFTSRAITLGGRLTRNDIVAQLVGEGAECTLDGLYVADGESLVDTHTTIDHAEPHCPSHEVYKGILAGKARAVFNGKIIVRQKAQKTDAKQSNMALLLTGDAQVNTKPQLEIFADDVRCTHGAAIGQLDEDAMFYLRARGIDDWSARVMLIHAFAGDILDRIAAGSLKDDAMKIVEHKLLIG
jgi:Fe-S cluster assembly protein SufD